MPSENPLARQLARANDALLFLADMDDKQAAEAWEQFQTIKAAFREWSHAGEQAFIERIGLRGELPIQTAVGERRLYVGNEKRTKCVNPTATLGAVLEATGGDLDAASECMSANAFKPGACRDALGDKWGEHFQVEVVADLRTGAAKRVVKQTHEED